MSTRQKDIFLTPWSKVEDHPLYTELTEMLGGGDLIAFLWHDTTTKWFGPWNPFPRGLDVTANDNPNATVADYVETFIKKAGLNPKNMQTALFFQT